MTATDPPTVLVVDDDPDVRSLHGAFLEPVYAVREADSGRATILSTRRRQ